MLSLLRMALEIFEDLSEIWEGGYGYSYNDG